MYNVNITYYPVRPSYLHYRGRLLRFSLLGKLLSRFNERLNSICLLLSRPEVGTIARDPEGLECNISYLDSGVYHGLISVKPIADSPAASAKPNSANPIISVNMSTCHTRLHSRRLQPPGMWAAQGVPCLRFRVRSHAMYMENSDPCSRRREKPLSAHDCTLGSRQSQGQSPPR